MKDQNSDERNEFSEEQEPAFDANEPIYEESPVDPEAQAKTAPAEKAAEEPLRKSYKTGTKVAAFIFFIITLAVFVVYEIFSVEFLYMPFAEHIDNVGEAIAAIFGYLFGLVMTFIFGLAQLPENIISIILFSRLRGKSDKKWENVLFTVMFALSIVMLLVMILSFALFLIIIATNK